MLYEITDDSFQSEVAKSDIPCVILFTAGWCTYCEDMVPMMEDLSEVMGDKVKFCTINIDEQKGLRMLFAVAALPYVVYVDGGMKTPLFDQIVNEVRLQERIQYMLDGGDAPGATPLGELK